ncbi:carbohydrate porin [Maribacter sp. 1_MG-2023]|uniref:carbohydrate porin n=1 Tax=Maribacter sp. 1_MG-2023 TaxID=3062677 RepID=UPI0026E386B2|nr:carbohydrate porin [Maribacter sp. 1_MG-2023]MDO6470408.1 carbohydrate porin [Maribacter sp. 1_MG-2023]
MKKLISLFFVLTSYILMGQVQKTDSTQSGIRLKNGIVPFVSYASIAAANVSGGLNQTSKYAGQLYTGLKFDFEKILGWKGTRAKISIINRHGSGLEKEVGSVFEPLNLVGGQNIFLYDLNVEKDFGDKFSLKAGRTTSVDDFSVSKLYYYSLNNTVNGVIRALLLDGLTTTFPFATWGTRLKYKPNAKHQFQLGVYQLGKNVFDDKQNGLDFSLRNSDDLSVFFQYDWFGKVADRNARIYLGSNQVFGSLANFNSDNISDYFIRLYGHIDVELVKGLSSFLTMAYSPHGEIVKLPFQSSIGLNWKGMVKSRPNDRILFFTTVGSFSSEWASLQQNQLSPEVVMEIGYRFQVTNYFVLQPAVQYNIRPGGSGIIANAVIPGIWIEANF